jgi:hypothetical protein
LLGISLGKANYRMKAADTSTYLYVLTPKGIETKARISVKFLQRKIEEYEALRIEIEQLKNELELQKVEES